jgi:transposase
MWTPADRALVGDFGSGQALTDAQFRLLEPLIPPAKPGGRPRTTDMRRLLDGLFCLVRTGCQWRHLAPPPALPPWPTVYGYMRAFLRDGVWESMRHHFVVLLREGAGREASPTAAVIDTQSAKTTESGGPRGWDAAKRLKGRKRHVAVDTDGLMLGVLVHAADTGFTSRRSRRGLAAQKCFLAPATPSPPARPGEKPAAKPRGERSRSIFALAAPRLPRSQGRQIFIIEPRQERPAAGVEPRRSLRGIAAELAGAGHVNPATNKPYSAEAIRLALAGAKEAA